MTRSKIQKMKFFMFLLVFLIAQTAASHSSFREKRNISLPRAKDVQNTVLPDIANNDIKTMGNVTSKLSIETVGNKSADTTVSPKQRSNHSSEGHSGALNPGALLRGFYVFIGLSVLCTAYIVFRSFRLNKRQAQMVRKYGVLAHRQDVEMRPLPLEEEDDEDTTVFDACNVSPNNSQHQNL